MRLRVKCRWMAIGVSEGFRQRTFGQPRSLIQDLAHRLAVEVAKITAGQCLLQAKRLE